MTVDLIKALEPRGAESKPSEGQGGDGNFPGVFESTLGSSGATGSGSERRAGTGGSEVRDAPEAGGEENDPAKAEAAAESGALGGEAGQVAERPGDPLDAERQVRDRLDGRDDEITGSRASLDVGLEEGEALDDEQAREILSRLEAEGLGAADGDEASANAEAAVTGAVASGVPQATAGAAEAASDRVDPPTEAARAEGGAEIASAEERDANSEQSGAQEQEPRRNDEASFFERAAEGSSQAGVDPNLRQAVANAEEAQRAPEVAAVDGAPAVASPVAGQVTETTTTATPGSPQPVAASEAISVQTEWLATRGGGTARLVLHPPELGEIAIRVSLRGGAVDVVMVAQEAVAQGMAEEQSERLSQAFANRDLRLENFEVRRGAAEDLPNGDSGRFAESETERDGRSNEEEGGRRGGVGGGEGADDAPLAVPRILTRAPETGVDLRI